MRSYAETAHRRVVAEYFKLSVPQALADRYERVARARKELGYRSASEAMIDVLRRRLEDLEGSREAN